jgi:hypothetical protein
MGLEASCLCRWPGGSGEVKALLESDSLILRGAHRQVFPLATLDAARCEGDSLCFTAAGEAFELALGAERAARWAKKILTPPPSLAAKLGIGPNAKALVIGTVDDPALAEALAGNIAATEAEARLSLAIVTDEAVLAAALRGHDAALGGKPIWIVHGKGRHATFGEAAVRAFMRAAGWMDNKVAAVSERLSATRYARRVG